MVNCQLAYIWLNYQHFQCSQNANNYFESIRHQYLCSSSFIWTCISDVNDYSHSAIHLNYFCGFIDGQNALQHRTIWNIHLKQNINIQFLKFVLFDNYWYCDHEYLKVSSNNKTSTFCGNRLPWVHDAADTQVKIILMTQRTGTKHYQLELLYHGAYIPSYQHYIIFTHSSSLRSIHYPNTKQNAFESFHLISSNRLDIMDLEAMKTRSKGQVVCYDGPGFKSPVLQFTYNQSVWKCLSSTFQMMCKFSRVNGVCSNDSRFYYRAIHTRDHQVKSLHLLPVMCHGKLILDEAHSKGTTKYIYHIIAYRGGLQLKIHEMNISFPIMLNEGNSCMYGGIYIVRTISSKDSEILSLCSPTKRSISYVTRQNNISVVIIHYSEYSTEKMIFFSDYFHHESIALSYTHLDLNFKYNENTLSIAVPKWNKLDPVIGYIHSLQLKLRRIQYINISCDASLDIKFVGFLRTSCMNITIFYNPHASNIRGRQYDQNTISERRSFIIKGDFIQSVFINMSACTFVTAPVWDILITSNVKDIYLTGSEYFSVSRYLPADILRVHGLTTGTVSSWLFTMLKPEDVPAYAIWRVFTDIGRGVSHVSIEFLTDNHHSSSVYEWHKFRSLDGIYITVDQAVNILIEINRTSHDVLRSTIWFI